MLSRPFMCAACAWHMRHVQRGASWWPVPGAGAREHWAEGVSIGRRQASSRVPLLRLTAFSLSSDGLLSFPPRDCDYAASITWRLLPGRGRRGAWGHGGIYTWSRVRGAARQGRHGLPVWRCASFPSLPSQPCGRLGGVQLVCRGGAALGRRWPRTLTDACERAWWRWRPAQETPWCTTSLPRKAPAIICSRNAAKRRNEARPPRGHERPVPSLRTGRSSTEALPSGLHE